MKKEYTIKLTIDDSRATDEGSDTLIPRDPDAKEFKITLNPNDPKQPVLEVAAHELGHVLGRIFKTPGAMADSRFLGSKEEYFLSQFGIESPEYTAGKLRSEIEAWDIGEKIVPIQPRTREIALDTYKRR